MADCVHSPLVRALIEIKNFNLPDAARFVAEIQNLEAARHELDVLDKLMDAEYQMRYASGRA